MSSRAMHRLFWMVWCPTGREPTVRHETYALALREAKRLAANVPGSEFYVLASVAKAVREDPITVEEYGDGVPF